MLSKERKMPQNNKGLAKKLLNKRKLNNKRIRKKERIKLEKVKKVLKSILLISLTIFLIIESYFYLKESDLFRVRDPIILGNKSLLNEEIYKKVKNYFRIYLKEENPNIFKIDLKDLSNYLKAQFIEIKEITVERKLPHNLVIKIIEKEPVALINTKYGLVNVDKEGYIFLTDSKKSFPIITGLNISKIRFRKKIDTLGMERVLGVINNINSINSNFMEEFSEFNIKNPWQINAYTKEEGTLIRFGEDLSLNMIKKLLAIISYLKKKKSEALYIDLRFKNIVVKFKNSLTK
jgi:cell division septal protein FtsQ